MLLTLTGPDLGPHWSDQSDRVLRSAQPTGERVKAGENQAVHLSFTRSPGPRTDGERSGPITPKTTGEKVNDLFLHYTRDMITT